MSPGGGGQLPLVSFSLRAFVFFMCCFLMATSSSGSVSHRQHVDECRDVDACPDQAGGFREEVKWLIEQLLQKLEEQFKEDVKVRSPKPQILGERLNNKR